MFRNVGRCNTPVLSTSSIRLMIHPHFSRTGVCSCWEQPLLSKHRISKPVASKRRSLSIFSISVKRLSTQQAPHRTSRPSTSSRASRYVPDRTGYMTSFRYPDDGYAARAERRAAARAHADDPTYNTYCPPPSYSAVASENRSYPGYADRAYAARAERRTAAEA